MMHFFLTWKALRVDFGLLGPFVAAFGSLVAYIASYMQCFESLRKARLEVFNSPETDPAHDFEPLLGDNFWSVFVLRRAWIKARAIKDEPTRAADRSEAGQRPKGPTPAERSVKHYVTVAFGWFLVLVGAMLGLAAALMQVIGAPPPSH
jgi:hypothetical protein